MSELNSARYFVGIDPGQYGGIAINMRPVGTTISSWTLHQMPVLEAKKGRFDLDLHAFIALIKAQEFPLERTVIAVEEPPYIPTNGGFAIRSLNKSFGEIRGVLFALGFRTICVPPVPWKAAILPGKSKDKEATIAHVKIEYPDIELPKHPKHPKKDHDGLADAVCLSVYAKVQHYLENRA
jgi:hypothetical protein